MPIKNRMEEMTNPEQFYLSETIAKVKSFMAKNSFSSADIAKVIGNGKNRRDIIARFNDFLSAERYIKKDIAAAIDITRSRLYKILKT